MEYYKIRKVGDLIGETFTFYKNNFKEIMKLNWGYLLVVILGGLITSIGFKSMMELTFKSAASNLRTSPAISLTDMAVSYFGLFIAMVGMYLFHLAQTSYITIKSEGKEATKAEVLKYVKYLFFRVFAGHFITFLVIMITVGGLGFLIGYSSIGSSLGPVIAVFGFLFLFVLYVFLIFALSVPMIFLPYQMLVKRTGVFQSIVESFKIHFRNFWPNVGALILLGLISYGISIAFYIVSYIISLLGIFMDFNPDDTNSFSDMGGIATVLMAVFSTLYFILNALVYQIMNFGMGLQYFSNLEKEEGKNEIEELKSQFEGNDTI